MKRNPQHLVFWIPCFFYYLFITGLSALSGNQLLGNVGMPFPHADKFAHFFLYLFLGTTVARALFWENYYNKLKRRWFLYFAIIMALAAIVDEIHQHFVPQRSPDVMDFVADMLGGLVGAILFNFILKKYTQKNNIQSEQELRSLDLRSFGFVLAMAYFVVVLSLNIFGYKRGIMAQYRAFSYFISLIEFGVLGYLTMRFLYLLKKRQKFYFVDWLQLTCVGVVFVLITQYSLFFLRSTPMSLQRLIWVTVSYLLGGIFFYLGYRIWEFRNKIWEDPFYKRKSWQRVYFFFPPLVIGIAIIAFSLKTPSMLNESALPMPQNVIPQASSVSFLRNTSVWHFFEYFLLGFFFFRAVMWENWWHAKKWQGWIFSGSYLFILVFAILDEYVQGFVPGRVMEWADVAVNTAAFTSALIFYLLGFIVIKKSLVSDTCDTKPTLPFNV